MIPQPLKWVGAVLALVVLVAVLAPMAYESITGMIEFSDDGGLISGGSDDPLDEEAAEEEAEAAAEGEEEEEEEEREVPDSYEVEAGDTLFSIAAEVYGDGSRWPEIAEANDIDPDAGEGITAGQELVIP